MEPTIIGIDVSKDRLDVHVRPRGETFAVARNAAGLDQLVERLAAGWTVAAVAVAVALGTSPRTVRKWRDGFAAEGEAGLRDRSSRPHLSPARLPAAAEAEIEALRRQRRSGPAIAHQLGRPVSTVGVALRRLGLGRLAALDPPRQVIRYERERPGELIHADEEPADQRHRERFHNTLLDAFYRVAFRKKLYRSIDQLQAVLDPWLADDNHHRPHQGRWCFAKTPIQTFLDALPLAKQKLMAA